MEKPKGWTFFRDKIFEIRVHLNRAQGTHSAVCSPASLAGLDRRKMKEMGKRAGKRKILIAQCGGRRGRGGVNGHGWTEEWTGCPASLQIRSNRLDDLSRAIQHHRVNQKRASTLGTGPPGKLGWELPGSRPVLSPVGQNLHYSGQQPHLSSCWLDYTGSWDTPNGVSHSASKNDGLADMLPKAPFTTFGAQLKHFKLPHKGCVPSWTLSVSVDKYCFFKKNHCIPYFWSYF